MAISYSYNDALNLARPQYPREAEGLGLPFVINMAVNDIWMAFDWRGSVAALPPFWLAAYIQDYGAPFYSVPTNFYGIREAYLVQVSNAGSYRAPIRTTENIERTSGYGMPTSMVYRDAIRGFRVWPCPPPAAISPQWLIDGTYKIRPPKINRADLGSPILWDDLYFECFVEAVAWAALVAAGRRDEAMKQKAIYRQALATATSSEQLEDGEPVVHPAEGYGILRNAAGPFIW